MNGKEKVLIVLKSLIKTSMDSKTNSIDGTFIIKKIDACLEEGIKNPSVLLGQEALDIFKKLEVDLRQRGKIH